jgi:hypothetical protein
MAPKITAAPITFSMPPGAGDAGHGAQDDHRRPEEA